MVASSAICDLLYQLGISANYKGFLHTAYAVSLCVEQQDRLFVGDKVAVSRCRQEVWDELEGGGTKYSNCIYYCLEAQSPLVGISFP